MGVKTFLGVLFALVATSLLILYWFIPFGTIEFSLKPDNSNFSLSNSYESMQFYPNMRFPSSEISYNIYDCPIQKKDDMKRAFDIIANQTPMKFYSVSLGEKIGVTCDSEARIEDGLFIAGEGGPTNITQAGELNVILSGQILLIKSSKCPDPNIAIHELLHVMGFNHSQNRGNIMYPVTNCGQTIGEDTINLLNELYSVPSKPDLVLENATAVMNGKYLDLNLRIRNNGLAYAGKAKINVFADGKNAREFNLNPLDIGYGRALSFKNIWISQLNVKEVMIEIDYSGEELDKQNNVLVLEIKK